MTKGFFAQHDNGRRGEDTKGKMTPSPSEQIIQESKKGVTLAIHIVPRAAKNEIVGTHGNALRIRLKAPPVEGAANTALLAFIAEVLGISPHQIELISGHTSRNKLLAITGLTKDTILKRLLKHLRL